MKQDHRVSAGHFLPSHGLPVLGVAVCAAHKLACWWRKEPSSQCCSTPLEGQKQSTNCSCAWSSKRPCRSRDILHVRGTPQGLVVQHEGDTTLPKAWYLHKFTHTQAINPSRFWIRKVWRDIADMNPMESDN